MEVIMIQRNRVKHITGSDLVRCFSDLVVLGIVPIGLTLYPISVSAESAAPTSIDTALQPLINTIRDLAKPICYGSMLWGWSKIMLGQKSAGQKQLKDAIGGFIGVQFTPMIFDIIARIGR